MGQELDERTRWLASRLGMEEAALAEAASIEYANTALGEDDVSNLLTILGKGGLPRLEMVGAIPVGALVSDALVELRLCELEQPLGAVGGMILAGLLPAATKLRSVNLEDSGLCGADMSGFEHFVKSIAATKIRRLNLSSNGLGDAGCRALAPGLRRSCVTHLYLAGNELCGVDMFRSGTHVTGGLKALCDEIPDTQIEHLDLSFNSIRDVGGAHVVEMLEIPDDTPYLRRSTVGHALWVASRQRQAGPLGAQAAGTAAQAARAGEATARGALARTRAVSCLGCRAPPPPQCAWRWRHATRRTSLRCGCRCHLELQCNELSHTTTENLMIAAQSAQWRRPQVAWALPGSATARHGSPPGGSHGWLGAALRTWKGAHRPEPKHTTQPLPKLRRTPAAFATRENLTLTLEDEPESE